jgi:NitT/TauT family transport system permease protein
MTETVAESSVDKSSSDLSAHAPDREIAFRGGGFMPSSRPLAVYAAFFCILAFWEVAVRSRLLNPIFLPAPSTIAQALWALTVSGQLWQHLSISLERILAGWVIGSLFGIAVGLAMGLWSLSRSVGLAIVSALFPIPKIALLPLIILWLGIGEASKVSIIALGVFFPTTISVYSGVDGVPRNLIRMAQSFGLSHWEIVRKIVLPGALPSIISGFRITTSVALLTLVAAEMIGAQYGIGAFVLQTGNMMLTDQLLAGVTVLSILGLCISWVLSKLEKSLFTWR